MRLIKLAAILAAATTVVQAHFTFVRLAHNGEWQAPTRFIRNKTEPFEERSTPNTNVNTRLIIFPTYPTDYPESVRCGRDNLAYAADTEVLPVQAGDTIEVAHTRFGPTDWAKVGWDDCPDERGSCDLTKADKTMDFNHPGPLLAHLSKVPDGETVQTYDGSGEWVKIYSLGLELNDDGSIHWLAFNYQQLPGRFVFKIPEQTPAGEYLLRLDLIWPALYYPSGGSLGDIAQMYPSCAQIKVESASTVDLPRGLKIPEDLIGVGVPGMSTSLSMYREQSLDDGYIYPAGPLWNGIELVEDKPVL